jgi:hypothetical protein
MRSSRTAVTRGFALLLGVALVLGGCSHAATPATTTTTPAPSSTTTTTTTTAAPTTTTTSTSSTTTTSTQPPPPSPCTAHELTVIPMKSSGTAGQIFSALGVVNVSATTCTLKGRPGITLIGGLQGASPAPLQATVLTTGEGPVFAIPPSLLTLPPSHVAGAGFLVQSSDFPSNGEQTCPIVTSMRVKLPAISSAFTVAEKFTACGGPTIFVSAIVRASALPPS